MSGYGPDARIWAGCSATGWMFGHGSDVQPRTECSGTGRWTCGRAAVRERSRPRLPGVYARAERRDRKSTRLNSSHVAISYAVFCLKKITINRKIEMKMLTLTYLYTV